MTTLKAEKRSMDVKAKRLRREGFVTGNVFGHAIEGSIPVKMNAADAERLLKTEHKGGQINLDIEGQVYDVYGAKKTGLSVIGVLYGYGSREELQSAGTDYLCETPEETAKLLKGMM